MKYNPFEFVDENLMKAVNCGVRVWNWTTGKTKTDLANSLLTVAPILEGAGFFTTDGNRTTAFIGTGVYILVSHLDQIRNKRLEKEEVRAIEKGAKVLPDVLNIFSGYLFAGSSSMSQLLFTTSGSYDHESFAIGNGLRALSHFVSRAEYFPPRKNVVVRIKERLEKRLKERQSLPSPLPQPAFSFIPCYESEKVVRRYER